MRTELASLFALACLLAAPARADLRVFACEPTWAALAREIGGDHVTVHSATTGRQDPHTIQARPSLIAKLRRADLLICSGAELEIGWLPLLLRRASNARVRPGQPGNIDVSLHVPMLEVPTTVDRSMGDVHPMGNPHTAIDPRNITRIAAVLSARLRQLDPESSEAYQARYDAFVDRWQRSIESWERRARGLRGMQLVTHHTTWLYLAKWLELDVVAQLEPKPGISPTPSYLSSLLLGLADRDVRAIVRTVYQPDRPSSWLSERTGIPALALPHTLGSTEDASDLFAVFDGIVARLLEVAK